MEVHAEGNGLHRTKTQTVANSFNATQCRHWVSFQPAAGKKREGLVANLSSGSISIVGLWLVAVA